MRSISDTRLADRVASAAVNSSDTVSGDESKWGPRASTRSASSQPHFAESTLRDDLGEAQRSREDLQTRLKAASAKLEIFRLESTTETKRSHGLALEKATLARKLKDREEELRGKAKLLEDVHDETVSLTLQLNMAEEQNKQLRKDNEELVDRWMRKVGEEATAMNKASNFS